MTADTLISADDHVLEPPDLWATRLARARWGDRGPRIARQPDGTERWAIDGAVKESRCLAPTGALSQERFVDAQRWAEVPRAAWDPEERLKALDRDGVEAQVLYPTASGVGGEALAAIQDAPLQEACVQAYNDWLLEAWAKGSPRFVPQCLLPVTSIEAAARELERAIARGHRGAIMVPTPWHANRGLPHLYDRAWDVLWARAVELDAPVCWHSGTYSYGLLDVYSGFGPGKAAAFDNVRGPVSINIVLTNFLFSGIPERFPTLKVVFASSGLDWLSFQLEVSDHEWERICRKGAPPYEMDVAPSEVFHRQCFVTTRFEKAGLKLLPFIGAENVMWHSEFPAGTSTWPRSRAIVEAAFAEVPAEQRGRVLSGNAARLYKIAGGRR